MVLHDTDRPEWRPLLNVMNQLVWSADGQGVHTVDGQIVVEDGTMTTIDEEPCMPLPSRPARPSLLDPVSPTRRNTPFTNRY